MGKNKIHFDRKYRFCGNGEGVAGLPHEVSEEEAYQMGLAAVLQAAIKLGHYIEIQPDIDPDVVSDIGNEQGE